MLSRPAAARALRSRLRATMALCGLVLGGVVGAGGLGASLVGCDDPAKNVAPPAAAPTAVATAPATTSGASTAATPAGPGPLVHLPDDETLHRAAPPRIVAIGDLHGDLARAQRAFRLAKAIDEAGKWIGGDTIVVQVGDQLDRGDDDKAIIDWLARLKIEARDAGGDVVPLLGNHEIMNSQLDFRYVTDGSNPPFAEYAASLPAQLRGKVPADAAGRAAAFFPGGPYALRLASQPIAGWIGQNLFAHGGILPKHVREGVAKLDRETREWLRGERPSPPKGVIGEDGIVWTRLYGAAPGRAECAMLDQVLTAYGAKRMVIGHTVQRGGIAAACDGKVWRIDCGLSRYYGGPVQVLQIRGDETVVLSDDEQ